MLIAYYRIRIEVFVEYNILEVSGGSKMLPVSTQSIRPKRNLKSYGFVITVKFVFD